MLRQTKEMLKCDAIWSYDHLWLTRIGKEKEWNLFQRKAIDCVIKDWTDHKWWWKHYWTEWLCFLDFDPGYHYRPHFPVYSGISTQGEITCFRISETWRKHATPCFRYVYVKVVRFRCIRSNGNARKRHETGNGNIGYPSCFRNGLTCFCHVSVYGFLQFRPVQGRSKWGIEGFVLMERGGGVVSQSQRVPLSIMSGTSFKKLITIK